MINRRTFVTYTVKQLAEISGVSVRTLHFYDEVGLLKPAYHGANGYRFYEDAQLLMLQQILFYKELGIELKQIQTILTRPDFDKVKALASHRKTLRSHLAKTRRLILTIDQTIKHMKGTKKMKDKALFKGFDPEQQARYEQYLIDRYGDKMKLGIAESKARVDDWNKNKWKQVGAAFDEICKDLTQFLVQESTAESQNCQAVIRRHYEWLKHFWTPTRDSYVGHAELIVDSELRKAYEAYDPRLPDFVASGIKTFAKRELS